MAGFLIIFGFSILNLVWFAAFQTPFNLFACGFGLGVASTIVINNIEDD